MLILVTFIVLDTLLTINGQLHGFDHCPNGSVRYDDSCYLLSHELANWAEAVVYCQAYGGHLAYIENAKEQNFIAGYLLTAVFSDTERAAWIGGTDALTEGEWRWATVFEPVEYTNWSPNEPNNDHGHQSQHQDCMRIYGYSGLWDDYFCESQDNFLCEFEINTEIGQIVG